MEEEREVVEDKLIALRENLIALGKGEGDIAPARAELPEIDRDVADDHSIVRILELWQAMFRDTFLHYHRLSTALVRSGDAARVLNLWNEYLIHVQSFLSDSLPGNYENLTEHERMCRVHRNLLESQRSVLVLENNANKDIQNSDQANRFDALTNLHNETLARIVERHEEVSARIVTWDDYRDSRNQLLHWLKEIEREKEKLQLRYVHIKSINQILTRIQNLSDKVDNARKQRDILADEFKKVTKFTDDAYASSVKMEYNGIEKRVDNLQASLRTWHDFLTSIKNLIADYERLVNSLHGLYANTQEEISSFSNDIDLSRPKLKKAIDKYTRLRNTINHTESQLENLSVMQEQLKDGLSPQDVKIVNQRVWQLRQQRADLEHQLSIIIHRLQERLETYNIFETRLTRFSDWVTTLESRLEISSESNEMGALDPQDLIRRINSEIQAETLLKEREFEWLVKAGSDLVLSSKKDEKEYSKSTAAKLQDVQQRWYKLLETGRSRIIKINELPQTITQLEEKLSEIRTRLHLIESQLSTSVVFETLTRKTADGKLRERDQIHKKIEGESGEVGETLNLCELVFNDPDVVKGNFDLRNLRTGAEIVDKKWKNLCEMSAHRKNTLNDIRDVAELASSLLPKVDNKLDSIEKRVEKIEARKERGESDNETVSKAVERDLDGLEDDIRKVEAGYGKLAAARGVEMRGEGAATAGRLRSAPRRWGRLKERLCGVSAGAHRQFVAAHGRAVVALAEVDVKLTRAMHLAPAPQDSNATLVELDVSNDCLLQNLCIFNL